MRTIDREIFAASSVLKAAAAPKGHSSLASLISCISQVVPVTPWGVSDPERSPLMTLESWKLEVAVRSRSWNPLNLAVVFVAFASQQSAQVLAYA